jgi:hypothetical protein
MVTMIIRTIHLSDHQNNTIRTSSLLSSMLCCTSTSSSDDGNGKSSVFRLRICPWPLHCIFWLFSCSWFVYLVRFHLYDGICVCICIFIGICFRSTKIHKNTCPKLPNNQDSVFAKVNTRIAVHWSGRPKINRNMIKSEWNGMVQWASTR